MNNVIKKFKIIERKFISCQGLVVLILKTNESIFRNGQMVKPSESEDCWFLFPRQKFRLRISIIIVNQYVTYQSYFCVPIHLISSLLSFFSLVLLIRGRGVRERGGGWDCIVVTKVEL